MLALQFVALPHAQPTFINAYESKQSKITLRVFLLNKIECGYQSFPKHKSFLRRNIHCINLHNKMLIPYWFPCLFHCLCFFCGLLVNNNFCIWVTFSWGKVWKLGVQFVHKRLKSQRKAHKQSGHTQCVSNKCLPNSQLLCSLNLAFVTKVEIHNTLSMITFCRDLKLY